MFYYSKQLIEKFNKVKDNTLVKIPDDFDRISRSMFITELNIDTRNINLWDNIKKKVRYYAPSLNTNISKKNIIDELSYTNKYSNNKISPSLKKYVSQITGLYNISQAWLKMYEIISTFDIIDKKSKTLKSFHICEAPGNFISAIDYYIKTHTDIKDFEWNAQSLNLKNADIKNTYGLIKKNPKRWDFGKDGSGDITRLHNIEYYKKYCNDVSLITSDCGIKMSFSEESKNKFQKLYYSQHLFILLNLPKNGNFVVKCMMPITHNFYISMIYLYYKHFKELIFYKPLQNQYSREFYIIGLKYNPIDNITRNKLLKFHRNFNFTNTLIDKFPESFMYQLVDKIESLANNYKFHIDRQLYYVDNFKYLSENDIEKIQKYIYDRNIKWVEQFNLIKE